MGLDAPAVKWLFGAKARGVDFSSLATLGRQSFFPERTALQWVFDRLSLSLDADAFLQASGGYGEKLLALLGATDVTSFDKSGYESASSLHDMNEPIDASFKSRFSTVLDCGTIEHVFNFPQAIRNCMEMVKPGGHFIQITGANDFLGHGFYQVTPELVYRVFSEANGFAVEAVALHEMLGRGHWYRMQDPVQLGHRFELTTRAPSYLLTIARKTADVPIFASWPQQSDYIPMWQGSDGSVSPSREPRGAIRSIRHLLPEAAVRAARRYGGPGLNSAVERLTDEAVIHGRF